MNENPKAEAITCQIRYTLNLEKLSAFESYAQTWVRLIERYGGVHLGYFIPGKNPDSVGASFPGLGYDGPADVALALFTFPDPESYRRYRESAAADPECEAAVALVRETGCFTRYERLFPETGQVIKMYERSRLFSRSNSPVTSRMLVRTIAENVL